MKGFDMGDKGKKDRDKLEGQKKGKQTLKEKRKTRKDRLAPGLPT
jgi:hypothetical protein